MTVIEAAQAQLREIARDLGAIKFRLIGVHASVPLSSAESDPLVEVNVTTDPVAEFHGKIESSVDEIDSLTQGILEAAREVT
jgi:hypothetical protein